jgi:hypothetical protein
MNANEWRPENSVGHRGEEMSETAIFQSLEPVIVHLLKKRALDGISRN